MLITGACATPPGTDIFPEWWLNPPVDAWYYYGVANAAVEEEEWSAWEEARNQGLQAIVDQVEARIYAMQGRL
jgi:hypothetical protein